MEQGAKSKEQGAKSKEQGAKNKNWILLEVTIIRQTE
jgi:hypothetical protein